MSRSRVRCVSIRRLIAIIGLALSVVVAGGSGDEVMAADHVIYSEGLANGWQNWSWGSYINLWQWGGAWGSQSIGWQITSAWGGLNLHNNSPVQTASGTTLVFALMGSRWGQQLNVWVNGENGQPTGWSQRLSNVGGDPIPYQWKWYNIPLSSLGAAGQRLTGVVIQDANGWAQPLIQVDEVKFTNVNTVTVNQTPSGGSSAGSSGGSSGGTGECLGVPAYPEVRWQNSTTNQTRGRRTDPNAFFGPTGWRSYYDRIDGNCVGSTEQILEWAAKKWGFDQLGYPDLAKAIGVTETWWLNSHIGPYGEVGILQVYPTYWPDSGPASWSTAYAADYAMAVIRSHYDGASWLGNATRGDLRGSVSAWNCGCAYNGWNWYGNTVFNYVNTKPWKRPGQPPEWF
jgi:hypothetical protein